MAKLVDHLIQAGQINENTNSKMDQDLGRTATRAGTSFADNVIGGQRIDKSLRRDRRLSGGVDVTGRHAHLRHYRWVI